MRLTSALPCCLSAALLALIPPSAMAQAPDLQTPPVEIALKDRFDVPEADARTTAIVAAAEAFLATLNADQRAAAVFPFDDNAQRSNWSNFPDGPVTRKGVMRGNLSAEQNAALDALLAQVLSSEGLRNVRLQLAGDDMLGAAASGGGAMPANFGSAYYLPPFWANRRSMRPGCSNSAAITLPSTPPSLARTLPSRPC